MVHAKFRERGSSPLPAEARTALHIEQGDEVEFEITNQGVVLHGLTMVPTDQAWFRTKSWLAGERRASADIDEGRITTYDNADDLLDALDK